MGSSKPNAPYGCNLSKYQHSNHSPKSGYALEVFKGKEAKLNLAILIILEQHGPLIILEILDLLHKIPEFKNVYLGSLTKRVHALEGEGYIMQVSTRKPKRGSKAAVYAIRSNALLAQVLNWMDPNALATKANDDQALTIASYIMLVLSPDGQELECAVA